MVCEEKEKGGSIRKKEIQQKKGKRDRGKKGFSGLEKTALSQTKMKSTFSYSSSDPEQ